MRASDIGLPDDVEAFTCEEDCRAYADVASAINSYLSPEYEDCDEGSLGLGSSCLIDVHALRWGHDGWEIAATVKVRASIKIERVGPNVLRR